MMLNFSLLKFNFIHIFFVSWTKALYNIPVHRCPKQVSPVLFTFLFFSVCACIYLFVPFYKIKHLIKMEASFTCLTSCPSYWLSIYYSTLASSCIAHKCSLCHLLTLVFSLHALVCLLIRCTSVLSLLVNPFFWKAVCLSPANTLCFFQSQVHFP